MISVLIPAYNAEKTIKDCVESVLAQSMQDFEIIMIDDGSTDRTPQILDEYASRDSRIRVFHQENAGLSAVRNRAVQESSGDELTFLDADDRLLPDCLAKLHGAMNAAGVSCVCCNHYIVHGTQRDVRFNETADRVVLSAEQALENILYHGIPDVSAWGKLYRRELLTNIRYPEGKLYEDSYVIADLILNAEKIAFISEPLYEYIFSSGSISKTCQEGHVWDFCEAVDRMTGTIESIYPRMHKGCIRRKAHAAMSTMRTLDIHHKDEWKKAYSVLIQYALPVLIDKRAPKRDKIGILAALPGYRFYSFIWGLYEKHRRAYG